jgi:hypothetical protein
MKREMKARLKQMTNSAMKLKEGGKDKEERRNIMSINRDN